MEPEKGCPFSDPPKILWEKKMEPPTKPTKISKAKDPAGAQEKRDVEGSESHGLLELKLGRLNQIDSCRAVGSGNLFCWKIGKTS